MMDWDSGFWIAIIIGCVIVIMAIIYIFYLVIQNIKNINANDIQKSKHDKHDLQGYKNIETDEEQAFYCFNFGYKLQEELLKYCPRCGSQVQVKS